MLVDIVLLVAIYISFRLGAKYSTFKNLFNSAKETLDKMFEPK